MSSALYYNNQSKSKIHKVSKVYRKYSEEMRVIIVDYKWVENLTNLDLKGTKRTIQGRPYLLAGEKPSNSRRCMHPSANIFLVKYSYGSTLL